MGVPVEKLNDAVASDPSVQARRLDGIWLFGSEARGEARSDSDVDLGILCEPALGADRFAVIDRLGRAMGRDVDVIDLAAQDPLLVWQVVTTGRLVFERDSLAIHAFLRRARCRFDDANQRTRMILAAQRGPRMKT